MGNPRCLLLALVKYGFHSHTCVGYFSSIASLTFTTTVEVVLAINSPDCEPKGNSHLGSREKVAQRGLH